MQRIHLYLKVVLEAEDDDKPERLGAEISRQVQRVYGVRRVEVQSTQTETVRDPGL
jgi:hypothetical protein